MADGWERPERLSRSKAFTGRKIEVWLERVRMPNGSEPELEIVRHPGASAVVPLTDRDTVLLVRQYRYASGGWLLEAPAGTLDEAGEEPETCARRELIEETGFEAGRLEALGWVWTTPGFTDERIWLWLATDLRQREQRLDADELLSVEEMPFERAVSLVHSGEIRDAKTICALLRAAEHRRR